MEFKDHFYGLCDDLQILILSYLPPGILKNLCDDGCPRLSKLISGINRKIYFNNYFDSMSVYMKSEIVIECKNIPIDKSIGIKKSVWDYMEKYWFLTYTSDDLCEQPEIELAILDYIDAGISRTMISNGIERKYISFRLIDADFDDNDFKNIGKKLEGVYNLLICDADWIEDKHLSYIKNIHQLYITDAYCITSLEQLTNVNKIYIYRCYDFQTFKGCENMHTIDMEGCKANDVSMLSGLHTLCIWTPDGNNNIQDVSMLGNLYELYIPHSLLSDISNLGNISYLNISGCPNVKDVSALGNVHYLDISNCPNITDVSALSNVHHLDISNCTNITDISALSKVHTLLMMNCPNVNDISGFTNHTLDISGTTNPDYIGQFSTSIKKLIVNTDLYYSEDTNWLFDKIPKQNIWFRIGGNIYHII